MYKTVTTLFFAVISAVAFGQDSKQAPEWSKSATMYELNVRQFSEEGTFEAIYDDLPRLREMGVDVIWLMPIHPIGEKNRKGTQGSYYAVKDYKGINPDFGDKESFQKLVDLTHQNGMKLIIDWVANHSAPDNVWVDQGHMDWYNLDSAGNLQPTIGTDWWDVADLNYDNPNMRDAMIDAMKYWVSEFDIDGYRCDVAGWVPIEFWDRARSELDNIKPVFMLAEGEEVQQHANAFDMTYGWEFHHVMNEVAKGHRNADSIVAYFKREAERYPSSAYRLHFTSNHDENSWNGTEFERMGDGAMTFAVLAATVHGMPLIYNGQETSLNKRLLFFEKDPIPWTGMDKADFYAKLFKLKDENPALWNGDYGAFPEFMETSDPDVLVYVRKKGNNSVLTVLNLSGKEKKVKVDLKNCLGNYAELFTGEDITISKMKGKYTLKPWEYRVYSSY